MSKVKKVAAITALTAILFLCGCAPTEEVAVDKTKVPTNYEASYLVKANGFEYTNKYTVTESEDKTELIISSLVDEPWENQKGEEGRQIITTASRLVLNERENASVFAPIFTEEEFKVTIDKAYYTHFTFEHDHALKSGLIKTKEYDANSETGFKENNYAVALADQYFDKDTLPFVIASFTDSEGVIKVSSGNRDKLQTVKYEYMNNETLDINGKAFDCKVVLLRPNTVFSVNSAKIWYDSATGILIKVQHDASVMTLTSVEGVE
ncbi:MAG: hypothetical protein IKB86_00105 [Clostridia bacterium]|nr:hypothetical protein [Clostridia bacterium]